MRDYESAIHVMAEALIEQFNGSDAVNFIEQKFIDRTNESNSFVLTMQKVSGLTPCDKLNEANNKIKILREALLEALALKLN